MWNGQLVMSSEGSVACKLWLYQVSTGRWIIRKVFYHYVSMMWCKSELPSHRHMETTKFDMVRRCFTLQEMLRSEIFCALWQQKIRIGMWCVHTVAKKRYTIYNNSTHIFFATHRSYVTFDLNRKHKFWDSEWANPNYNAAWKQCMLWPC